jgi:membrane-bound serine protease (ClpP class)
VKPIALAFLVLLQVAAGADPAGAQAAGPQVVGPQPAAEGTGRVAAFLLPIEGEIDRSLVVFLRRGIEEARKAGARTVIFDISTFGGRVDSALQITTLIGSLRDMESIAYVSARPEGMGVSWSAGSLIALSCSRIYMAPGTSMGAAAPVYQTAEGTEMAPEKEVSAVRAQMAALAEKNGYPRGVALAMVDKDVELLEVYVDGQLQVSAAADLPALQRQAAEQGKSLERGKVISPAGKLLTLTAGEMERYGVSSATVSSVPALLDLLGLSGAQVRELEPSLPDRIVTFLTSAAVTAVLVLVGLVALYLEITSPGFGVPGTVAIIAFATIFIGGALLGTVGSLEIILFVLGVALLVVEIFLIPGFGITGVSGILLMVAALVLSRQQFIIPRTGWQWDILLKNLRNVGLGVFGSLLVVLLLMRLLPRTPLLRRLILEATQENSAGYTVQDQEQSSRFLGKRGKALTVLRPAGKAELDGEIVSVETEGEFIEPGSSIEVFEVSGNRVLVRRV